MLKSLSKSLFGKFIVVGILNTLFGYALFSIFIYLSMHYYFAVALATALGVLFNFKTLGKLVFNNGNNKLFFKFTLVYIGVYLVNIIILKALLFYSADIYAAGAVATFAAAIFSYLLNKEYVFKKEASYEIN